MTSIADRFLEGPHQKAWSDLTASTMWAEAVMLVRSHLAIQFANPTDPTAGAKMAGANAALSCLSNLSEPAPKIPSSKRLI